jgi:hypothetical protein
LGEEAEPGLPEPDAGRGDVGHPAPHAGGGFGVRLQQRARFHWTEVERRGDYEVASIRQHIIGGERAFCEDCVRAYPTTALRAVLDQSYGRERALKPVPVAPPPPSAEELAEQDRLYREQDAIAMAARAIWPIPDHAPVTAAHAARVKRLLLALDLWAASRPAANG